MSWLRDLEQMSGELDEEFGTMATVEPMIARPNERMRPDPKRPKFCIVGIFHENHRFAGDGKRSSDGMRETMISSTVTTFSAPRSSFMYPPTVGDVISLTELARRFRVIDIQYEMPTRTRLILESLDPVPHA